ncbi:hypothetical protein GJAV_G00200830 [Gymnothorax javanicus]|nr:hypothetical protein GJAV_G00200830 [Gymnothorax javanicus]
MSAKVAKPKEEKDAAKGDAVACVLTRAVTCNSLSRVTSCCYPLEIIIITSGQPPYSLTCHHFLIQPLSDVTTCLHPLKNMD